MSSQFPAQPIASANTASADGDAVSLLGRITLVAGLLLAWIVQHGYNGIFHDSQIYTLPAVARLHPELLANDIMLRLGSQDSFTLFSPLYSAAIGLFGVEPAAALITFVSQLAFFIAAAMFVRKLMPQRLAWLAIGLACVIPAFYGSRTIFTVVEDFATPRLMAEALVLAALTCFMSRRYWIAGVLAVAATSLHPLMAAGGIAVAVFLAPVSPRMKAWIIAGAALAAALVLGALAARSSQFRFDEEWLHLLEVGTDYLFIKFWTVGSFSRATVMLGTLLVGTVVLERSPARSLCWASFLAAIAGTAFSFVGGDLLRIVLVVQVQLWRWNWIANLVAILLLPLILTQAWSRGSLWRTAALLLGAAWLCIPEVYAFEIMALVGVLCAVASKKSTSVPARVERQIFMGGCALTGLAVVYHVATSVLFANAVPDQSEAPEILRRVRSICNSGVLPAAAFIGLAAIAFRAGLMPLRAATAAVSVLALAVALPVAAREWTREDYSGQTFSAFAEWRAKIPVGTEVLWPDAPLASWLLLQRPSYVSNVQEVSGLFSRAAAFEMKSRIERLASFLGTEPAAGRGEQPDPAVQRKESRLSLAELCAAAVDVKFVVTSKNLSATPIATAPPGVSNRYKDIQLYRCPGAEG